VSILRKLVSDNTNVLAEFVSSKEGLGLDDLKLIEFMIRPPTEPEGDKKGDIKKLPKPWTNREFL
jgi:hypothetical protein